MNVRRLIAGLVPISVTFGVLLWPVEASEKPTVTTIPATTSTSTTTTTVDVQAMERPWQPPQPSTTLPFEARCPDWLPLAVEVGWPADELQRLDVVLWGESRCQPDVHYDQDPNGGSYGLLQVNGFWCRTNLYNPHPAGFIGARLDGFTGCTDLFDPITNLRAALLVYEYADSRGCGWGPWSTAKRGWCD